MVVRDSRVLPAEASFIVPAEDPLWYKDAVLYEVHVRAFRDSSGDGVGDFRGLTERLDYIQELGVTAVWLLPFWPSPWKDDGYDASDFQAVHEAFGTLDDFRGFVEQAHSRGIRVITELVLNHTSDQHPWFERARRAPKGSAWRNFYVWSETPERYGGVRIIFKDFEHSNWTWDPVAESYYWHRFYSHQPDLNYENPEVRRAVFDAVDFWLDLGVDGLRLDAVPYLYETEGTPCENAAETHGFLKELRAHIDGKYQNRMLLAEANQWPTDAVAYFGDGDECQMAFHFPVMPRLFMALRMEESYPIIDVMEQTPAIPENCQWAVFLRNHDELTLEMVCEEEREYMYRTYAHDPQLRINLGIRRRLAPLLGNDRRRLELMNSLLFALPGTPVIYYGDEIGMGENTALGDRNGVRTPFQWDGSANAGFSEAAADQLFLPVITDPEYHYTVVNAELEQRNPDSLLWWMRKLIALRKQSKAFARGTLAFVRGQNRHVLAFEREFAGERILVVANLSKNTQPVELRLEKYAGFLPVEMFGGAEFPVIRETPYPLSLAPHAFYWFRLRAPGQVTGEERQAPELTELDGLRSVLDWEMRTRVAELLPPYLRVQPWFRDYARTIGTAEVLDVFPLAGGASALAIIRIAFTGGDPELYLLPLRVVEGQQVESVLAANPEAVLARLRSRDGTAGLLATGCSDPQFYNDVMSIVFEQQRVSGHGGELSGSLAPPYESVGRPADFCYLAAAGQQRSRNSTVAYGNLFVLKLFRRLEEGPSPDVEIGRYLFEQTSFGHTAAVVGAVEYRTADSEPMTAGALQAYVDHQGDAWSAALEEVRESLARALAERRAAKRVEIGAAALLAAEPGPVLSRGFAQSMELLGRRTAELHCALASGSAPEFAPESSSHFYQQSLDHGMISLLSRTLELLELRKEQIAEAARGDALAFVEKEASIRERLEVIRTLPVDWKRIRIHGDLHLQQVLLAGGDFVFIDFEGENSRPLRERRIKASPLEDVAGMLRSLHYAAVSALFGKVPGHFGARDRKRAEGWCLEWYAEAAAAFLGGYSGVAKPEGLLPASDEQMARILDVLILKKAVYELHYELNRRPDWVPVALRSLLHLFE